MNTPRILGLSLLLATAAAAVNAQDLSREQVVSETHAAQVAGLIPHGDLDISAGNKGPDVHPALSASTSATRGAVKAELASAVAAGDVVTAGEEGRTLAEINPSRYPQPAQAVALTRAQVRAELAQAIRDGDIAQGDEGRTLAEINPQRYAAVRVRDGVTRYASN